MLKVSFFVRLDSCPAEEESDAVRIVSFDKPLTIAINGRKGAGIVTRPDVTLVKGDEHED